jgi:quercetin 2,3-dioxygenase
VSELVVTDSRSTHVGELGVRRALPTRGRRTVGAWCFFDHMGPASFSLENRFDIAPHPHIGLQTVTWLFDGALLHRDGLGSEQQIRPGQLNLMTSGKGLAHSEENPGVTSGQLHGVQLWVALPSTTRQKAPAFEHHAMMPEFEMDHGTGTVIIGEFAGEESPARRDSELVGVELRLARGVSEVALDPTFEYALVVTEGELLIDETPIGPGRLCYLGRGRDECRIEVRESCRALLIGGLPFDETIVMWWNFVARTQEEIALAYESWVKRDPRFARVASPLPRIEVAPPPWFTQR